MPTNGLRYLRRVAALLAAGGVLAAGLLFALRAELFAGICVPLLKRDVWPAATLAGAQRNRARLPVYRQLFIGRHGGPFAALGTQWHAAAEPS